MAGCPTSDSVPNPVARAICVLQEKWVLHIVHALLQGPRGFNELGREVGGCNPSTLRDRLGRLEQVGLVTRACRDQDGRPRYTLTTSGEGLKEVIDAIHAWSLLHLHSTRGLPTDFASRIGERAPTSQSN